MLTAGPEESHVAFEERRVTLEVESGSCTALPDAEPAFTNDGRVLPADAEIEFGGDRIAAVEKSPSSAASQTGLLFVGPISEADLRRDGAVDDEAAGARMLRDVEPPACEIDAERRFRGCF